MAFELKSKSIQEGGTLPLEQVFNGFGHSGGNTSPNLSWTGAPEGTKSFVLSLYDRDAPTGSGFWHWVVVDIPAGSHELVEGAGAFELPAGARQTLTDFGQPGFGGAAPNPGPAHRYVFTLQALSVETLLVPDNATGAMVGFMAGMSELGRATLNVTYGL